MNITTRYREMQLRISRKVHNGYEHEFHVTDTKMITNFAKTHNEYDYKFYATNTKTNTNFAQNPQLIRIRTNFYEYGTTMFVIVFVFILFRIRNFHAHL